MTDTILRRMPDYVNLHLPAVLETHEFPAVPMVDTSNPFIARTSRRGRSMA